MKGYVTLPISESVTQVSWCFDVTDIFEDQNNVKQTYLIHLNPGNHNQHWITELYPKHPKRLKQKWRTIYDVAKKFTQVIHVHIRVTS
jgi:hypothetical protein